MPEPSTDLARVDPDALIVPVNTGTMSDQEIDRLFRIAKALALSKVFKDVTQAEQAFAKILVGRDLGLSPAQSLSSMDFVKGNIQMRAVTLAGFVKRSPKYDYRIATHSEETCSILFSEIGPDGEWREAGASTFTIKDATKAKLVKPDSAWVGHPRNMLFARAMSNGVKWYCPDLMGGIPVYTEGDAFEIDDRRQLGAGTGNGEAEGLDLGPMVEAIIARATELGYVAYMDRASIEVALGDQTPEFIEAWVKDAHRALDAFEAPVVEGEASHVE